ncbi:peptidylprolyl isomerase [Dokdonella sp.]|uniref:peptidylprolyl isomerase n=1 Tax=Dokdonella sp. TaxID=2291710 RepID=UPI001B01282C|nr:peptidylprolyl isomerase [Dokdonella sp.]MBO9663820.1 peptidylprolyl isomerase [Dokdonella sp.]
MKSLLAALTLATFSFVAAGAAHAQAAAESQPLDRIVAVVGEDVVLQSELDRDVSRITSQYAQSPQQLPPHDVLERQVLDRLILQKLQLARADDTGVKVSDAEIDRSMGEIAQQNGLELSQLRGALTQQGIDYDQFRRNVRDQLIVRTLRQRIAQGRAQVSDAEIDSLIRNGNLRGGQLHLGYIVVNVPDGATPDQIDEAQRKAEEAKKQIDDGMDFSAAAIRYSSAQNALQGGDLGWRNRDELPPALADAADKLQEGQVSPPMRGPNGFHIIKLLGKRDGGAQMVTEYHARHILMKPSELLSSDEAHKQLAAVRQKIAAGEDFEKAARESSQDDATARLGGDLGWFSGTAYGSRVAEQLQNMKPGDVSQPFETDAGWHILQLVDTRNTDKSGELQRDQARNILYQRKAEDEYESFLRQIRSEAYVDIRLPGGNTPPKPATTP